jgi:uncharacterized protein
MSYQDPTTAGPSSDQKTMALIAHLLGILTWFIGALVIWLINKDQSDKAFVNNQAKEALNFQITIGIAYIIAVILMIVSFGILFFLPTLVWLGSVVFSIIGGIKANNGETYRYPFALRLIK